MYLLRGYSSILSNGIFKFLGFFIINRWDCMKTLLETLYKPPNIKDNLCTLLWTSNWIEYGSPKCCLFAPRPGSCVSLSLSQDFLNKTCQALPLFSRLWRPFKCARTDMLVTKGESLSPSCVRDLLTDTNGCCH